MRIPMLSDAESGAREQALFDRARRTFGWVPNTIRVMARGSSVGEIYLEAGSLNRGGTLSKLERELVAIATAAHNGCEYCGAAHTAAALAMGASEAEVAGAREGRAEDERTNAILRLAKALLVAHGRISEGELEAARGAGLDEQMMLDVVAVVGENTIGNMVNNLAQTELDGVLKKALARSPA